MSSFFDPRDTLAILNRRKWLVLLPLALVTAAAYASTFLITPLYESSLVVWTGSPVKLSTDLERMLGEFRDIVGSRSSRGRDIRELHRDILSSPYLTRALERIDFSEDVEYQAQLQRYMLGQNGLTAEEAGVQVLASRLRNRLELEYISRSHLRIKVQSESPYAAQDLAEAIGDTFVEEKARQELSAIFSSLEFSYDQLARYENELQGKIDERTKLEREVAERSDDEELTSDINRGALAAEMERRTEEIRDHRTHEDVLLASLGRTPVGDYRLRDDAEMRLKKSEIQRLIASLSGLIQEYAWSDPTIANLSLRIVRLEDDVERSHARQAASQLPDLDVATRDQVVDLINTRHRMNLLNEYVDTLSSGLSQLNAKLGDIPGYRAQLDRLNREITTAQRLRDRFKEQQESFEISQALVQETRFKVVETARLQLGPVWPDHRLILIAGVIVGLMIGGLAVFVVEYSDRSLRDKEQVEEWLGIPVVGILPKIEGMVSNKPSG